MKQVLNYFKIYHNKYLSIQGYLAILMFISTLIATNYYFNIENGYIDKIRPTLYRIPAFLGLNLLGYFGVLFILKKFRKDNLKITKSVIGYSFLGLLILSIDRSVFTYFVDPILGHLDQPVFLFWFKILYNSYGWITIFSVLLIAKLVLDKNSTDGFYGLSFKNLNGRFYLLLVLAVIPIALIGALSGEIGSFYPVYQRCGGTEFASFHGISELFSVAIYEFFYLTDFLNTELLFRGFLVIGASKYLGKDAVLPMVAAYAVLHFGKPIGETISSVFGGYLLGVLAFYSRNIWGGVLIHTTLAGSMELFAYLF